MIDHTPKGPELGLKSDFLQALTARGIIPLLDLDGTLVAHNVSDRKELQAEAAQLVVKAFQEFNQALGLDLPLVTSTNKTAAEVRDILPDLDVIIASENGAVLSVPVGFSGFDDLNSILASYATEGPAVDSYQNYCLARPIAETSAQLLAVLESQKEKITEVLGFEPVFVSSADALSPEVAEVCLEDFKFNFGLDAERAKLSAQRVANSHIFCKKQDGNGDLVNVSFKDSWEVLIKHDSGIYQDLIEAASVDGITLLKSTKALSFVGQQDTSIEIGDKTIDLSPDKSAPIVLMDSLYGKKVNYLSAGDADNDLPAVTGLKAITKIQQTFFLQLPKSDDSFNDKLSGRIASEGITSNQITAQAPVGMLYVARSLLAKDSPLIPEIDQLITKWQS